MSHDPQSPSDAADFDDQWDEDDDDDLDDCGMMANGQCMKAGSEECDWICPRHGRRL